MAKKERLLVVDDAPLTLEVLERTLTSAGYSVITAGDVIAAGTILESTPIDLVITDYKMPRLSGLDLIRHVRENFKDTEVMMITGYASIEGSVNAVKAGASEYLPKPFTDAELFSAVKRALDKLHLRTAARTTPFEDEEHPYGLIGESPPMRHVFHSIRKVAATTATVLISGESGTGKELVARAVHYRSPRASAPFVPVNCGGIPEGLLESELFGYVKGAFTGAVESRAGFFQTSDGGTIFLDEVGDTSLSMQTKLLRVLQEKEVCMIGARRTRKVDVRVLAATNKDLSTMVTRGAFREDLYYRLNVINIAIPPLRDRGDDIPVLVGYFAARYAREVERPVPRFSDKAMEVLRGYYWPGNVRELENVVQRIVVMTDGDVIEVPDLPSLMRFSALREPRHTRSLAEVEAEHIRTVLAAAGGNKTRASRILGIDRKTLREKLSRHEP